MSAVAAVATAIEWLEALSPPFIKLINALASPAYDEEAEKQAMLDFTHKIAEVKARKMLGDG